MRRVGTMLWVAENALGNLSRGESVCVKMTDGKVSSLNGSGVPDDFEDLPACLRMSMKTMQNAMTIISKERDITLRTQRVDEKSFRIIRVW